MKFIVITLILILMMLQVRLWIGDGSIMDVMALQKEVKVQQQKVAALTERNKTLEAEVLDLKHHLGAVEERARTDLGMIRKNETFYQFPVSGE